MGMFVIGSLPYAVLVSQGFHLLVKLITAIAADSNLNGPMPFVRVLMGVTQSWSTITFVLHDHAHPEDLVDLMLHLSPNPPKR